MFGKYVGYVSGDDGMHGFLCRIVREKLGVSERSPAFRAFRLRGSNEVYAYEEKSTRARMICKFYGPRFGWDRDRAGWTARAACEGVSEQLVLERYADAMGIALGRTNDPADVVAMVLFLLSEGARNITGQELVVDGGTVV